jgi:hypothetical protein
MNIAKIVAYSLSGLVVVFNLLQLIAPVLPVADADLITALGVALTTWGIKVSHSPESLAQAGYTKLGD